MEEKYTIACGFIHVNDFAARVSWSDLPVKLDITILAVKKGRNKM